MNQSRIKKIILIIVFITGFIYLSRNRSAGNICLETKAYLLAVFIYFANMAYLVSGRQMSCKRGMLSKLFSAAAIFLVYPVAIFYCIEIAYNADISRMQPDRIIINCLLVLLMETGLLIAFRHYKCVLILLGTLAWSFGAANHYLLEFKGCTLRPVELCGWKTALQVADLYEYKINEQLVVSTLLFLTLISLVRALPYQAEPQPRKKAAVRLAAGSAYFIIFIMAAAYSSWDTKLGITIEHWSSYVVYARNGSILSFILEGQEMYVRAPEGYEPREAEARLDSYECGESLKQPTVIVIMNESFSDLSQFLDFGGEECLTDWNCMDCVMRGNAYVSTYGGGTCNSEFEFLTGNSMANFPENICPYTMYNFGDVFNLARVFRDHGYNTIAIHPDNKNNWNRSSVYSAMGFQRFISIDQMAEADRIRACVSDRSNYDRVIQEYEESKSPVFIFNVTIQNHGGYESQEALGDIEPVVVGEGYRQYTDLITYLTLIRESDRAFRYLVDYFAEVDEPVIICMFGDHQPGGLNRELINGFSDETAQDVDVVQRRYCVPYLIWTNAAGGDIPSGLHKDMSLNYLGANVLAAAGIETPYTEYLLELQQNLPVINGIGYMDRNTEWHNHDTYNTYAAEYRKMGYYMMFDSNTAK